MAALDEMVRQDAERVRERLARRLAEKQAESEASYERVQRIREDYRPVLQMRTGARGGIDDGYTRRMPDHGVEELDFE